MRLRLAFAFLIAASACAAGFLASTPSQAAPEARAWSHRITSMTGEYVDHWTVDEPEPCGLVGDGTVTIKYRMAVSPRVRLVYVPTASAEPSGYGKWVVGIPSAHGPGLVDAPGRLAAGTITLVDNTLPRPPRPGGECQPPDKSSCGATSLNRAMIRLGGYNRRFLITDLPGVAFRERGGNGRGLECRIGQTESFTDPRFSGGTRLGELLLRMPSAAAVKRRRVLVLTGTSHKRTSTPGCESDESTCTDDVTRRVTVTFKRL